MSTSFLDVFPFWSMFLGFVLLFTLNGFEAKLLALVDGRNPLGNPLSGWRTLQVVIEKLLHSPGEIDSVLFLTEAVRFAIVVQHPNGLLQAAHRQKQLDSLVPRHRAVLIVVQHQQGRLDLVSEKHRRIFEVKIPCSPQSVPDTTLSFLILKHSAHARPPANAAIRAGHVRHRRTGFGTGEDVRHRDQVGDLIPSPAMPLNTDAIGIHESEIDDRLDARQDRVGSAAPWETGFIGNVRHKQDIPPAHIETEIDR